MLKVVLVVLASFLSIACSTTALPPTDTPPAPTPTQTVTEIVWEPGERQAYFKVTQQTAGTAMQDMGYPPPSEAQYESGCRLLRKHDFDVTAVGMDSATSGQVGMLVGGLDGMFKVWERTEFDSRLNLYTLRHFCSDVMQP